MNPLLPHPPSVNKFRFWGTFASVSKTMCLLVACLVFHQAKLLASGPGEESWINWLYGGDMDVNNTFSVQDDRLGNTTLMQEIHGHQYIRDVVWLELNEDTLMMKPNLTNFELVLGVEITEYDSTNTLYNTENKTFSVKYFATEGLTSPFIDYFEFSGASKMEVKITSFDFYEDGSATPITDPTTIDARKRLFRLYGKVIVKRKYKNDTFCTDLPAFNNVSSKTDTTTGTLLLTWQPVAGAEEYDLEWAFHDSLSEQLTLGINYTPPTGGDYDFLFKNNASRVTLDRTTYAVPLIYPKGRIYYRVRAVRYTYDGQKRELGKWSSLKGTSTWTVDDYPDRKWVEWHEQGLNWQAQAIFVEDGKRSHSIRYFDGSLRERQSVVKSEDNNIAITSETVYDNQGRAAIKVMPAPSSYNNTQWIKRLRYNPKFIRDNSGGVYDKSDFDANSSCSGAVADQVSNSLSAVGRYYSSSNPDADAPTFDKFIPSAGGYPFSVTEYTPDQTGRVKRQGGVGGDFQLGSTHEVRYFYGKPSQEELDRLFGNEVGYASHYMKNMVVDPNQQASVSYVDAHGRTIATALSGPKPANMYGLPSLPTSPPTDTMNLLNNIKEATTLVSTSTLLVANATNTYNFGYQQTPKSFDPDCKATNVCYDCMYDLNINIQGICSSYSGYNNNLSYSGVTLDSICNLTTNPLNNNFTLTNLPIGEYRITKTLSLSQTAIDYYLNHYLNNNSCLPSLQDLTDQFLAGNSTYCSENGCTDCQDLDECQALNEMLKADVSPDGQYASYSFDAEGNFAAPSPADPTSIFDGTTPSYQSPCSPYLNEDGTPSYVSVNGVPTLPKDLSIHDFIKNWQPSWANSLVCKHPEYCYLTWCQDNAASNSYDDSFFNTTTYSDALAAGFLDPFGGAGVDPFFQPGGQGNAYLAQISYNYTHFSTTGCETITLPDLVASIVYCNGILPCNLGPGSGCTSENDLYWQIFQMLYEGLKFQYKSLAMEDYATANDCSHNTTCFCLPPDSDCTGTPCADKLKRALSQVPSTDPLETQLNDLYNSVLNNMTDETSLPSHCDLICTEYANKWVEQLLFTCPTLQAVVNTADSVLLSTLRTRFAAVCKNGCDATHMYGSTTVDPALAATSSYDNLKEALNSIAEFAGLSTTCDTLCNVDFIGFPGTYAKPQYTTPKMLRLEPDSCTCSQLASLRACWMGYTSGLAFEDWLNQFSDLPLTAAQIADLESYCVDTNDCDVLPEPIAIPPSLECGVCKTCTEVQEANTAFGCATTEPGYKLLYATRLNSQLGLNLSYDEYQAFLERCSNDAIPTCAKMLCPNQLVVPAQQDTACWSILVEQAEANAQLAYDNILDSLREDFLSKYFDECLNNLTESFTVIAPILEYHYTLYYYDQSGNLVRTVPPKAVVPITSESTLYKVKKYRQAPATNLPQFPVHIYRLINRYWYNTFDKLTRVEMPDITGANSYWYDKLGRPVASQFARQADGKYNYMRYDALGRIIETGEKTAAAFSMNDNNAQSITLYNSWLGTTNRIEVVKTFYDDKITATAPFAWQNINNTMRSRVASTTYSDTWSSTATSYTYATHYDYDIAGNMKTLVQEIPELQAVGWHNFKRIDYDYDLISGKLNAVYYQRDSMDQFMHRYSYDDDVRLDYVETSRDGLFWEHDATYDYYKHGPLARAEFGERRVQGLDYAYTIQGWLKGVNSGYINIPSRNMGRDGDPTDISTGVANPNKYAAWDAIGFTLGYYQGDYTPITTLANQDFELATPSTAGEFGDAATNLFNGNIRHAVYSIKLLNRASPRGYTYKYDQLNRLKLTATWQDANLTTWTWAGGTKTQKYRERYAYDPNGNIDSLIRYDNDAFVMDSLSYKYLAANRNLLDHIDDLKSTTTFTGDLEDQAADNYVYDNSGFLLKDIQEDIGTSSTNGIAWTVDGKLKSVTKTSTGSPISTFYYDAMRNRVAKRYQTTIGPVDRTTYYIRDAQGNVMATYLKDGTTLTWKEAHIYGSTRLGMELPELEVNPRPYTTTTNPNNTTEPSQLQLQEGWKRYELTNHLGNVLSAITDRKLGYDLDVDNIIETYLPEIIAAQDYYPFGMQMPGRTYQNGAVEYRYGFQGQEEDDEIKGDGNSIAFEYRIYDPRAGRFLSIDPLSFKYPHNSPYSFQENKVGLGIELEGLELGPAKDWGSAEPWLKTRYEKDGKEWILLPIQVTFGAAIAVETFVYAASAGVVESVATTLGPGFVTGLLRIQYWAQSNPSAIQELGGTVASIFDPNPAVDYPGIGDNFVDAIKILFKTDGKIVKFIAEAGSKFDNASEREWTKKLLSEGKNVTLLLEENKKGIQGVRSGDWLVDGIKTELKKISDVVNPTSDRLSNAISQRIKASSGQAKHLIIDLTEQAGAAFEVAVRGVGRYFAQGTDKESIRIVGEGYDQILTKSDFEK